MRYALRRIALSIKDLAVNEFDLEQLKSLNIRVDPMILDETSPHKPSYFAPYPEHLVLDPDEEALGGAYNGIYDEMEPFTRPANRAYEMNKHLSHYIYYCSLFCEEERTPWTTKCVGDYPFQGLYKYAEPAYGCYRITDLNDPTYPHVKAVMYNNMVATDSTILHGELFPIVRIMITQFWKRKFAHQMVSPVLIISLMGFKARVIEAYFEDQTRSHAPDKYWYMGPPIGDTIRAA
ncbi:hypothetical protein EMCG_05144 [[Emmonsia] crescens]|uniref:Uncharacterized protein n=1 Tax=[Emmonsia] crescens TaxID=73230 RepID=A0A0G2IXZ2_9EURO|nr:hypothetical protein EMCG_05144 [Emmonsia crescens UAMH 3008]